MTKTVPFSRTNCNCKDDIKPCKTQPGYMITIDLIPITYRLLVQGRIKDPEEALKFFKASKGALVGNSITGHTWRIPTITPKMKDGRCVFLDAQDRCSIHDVSPFGCKYFDVHMDAREGSNRSAWGLRQIQNDPAYKELRETLAKRDGSDIIER